MNTFFVLGTQPALSIAEIAAVTAPQPLKEVNPFWAMADISETTNATELMAKLGGTVKIGRLPHDKTVAEDDLQGEIMAILEKRSQGRVDFGISVYGAKQTNVSSKGSIKSLGMEIKKEWKSRGLACRWIAPQQGLILSSVVVEKNKLTTNGTEIIIFIDKKGYRLGVTEAVQPFEEFSQTDYGRPSRDMDQGMLPPKVARMMLNITDVTKESVVADPFCGSGTVLMEAMQLGVIQSYASDKNKEAVANTEKNLQWLNTRLGAPTSSTSPRLINTFHSDARHIGQHIPLQSLDAIVTEPFLGPNRNGRERRGDLQRTLDQLSILYADSLREFKKVLKAEGIVLMILPIYLLQNEKHGIIIDFEKLGYTPVPILNTTMAAQMQAQHSKYHGLVYGRPGQFVWREIVKLKLQAIE